MSVARRQAVQSRRASSRASRQCNIENNAANVKERRVLYRGVHLVGVDATLDLFEAHRVGCAYG